MGVSFKVAKTGTRYRQKLPQIEDKDNENSSASACDSHQSVNEGNVSGKGAKVADHSNVSAPHSVSEDLEVSFSLNLFPNGFSIGKPTELFNDEPNQLHPYDRASQTLFTAIEYGWLPGDIFDDIPCKYVNGALLCEIRDYRNSLLQIRGTAASVDNSPIVHKVLLQMCMENVVKDISLISDDSWTYEDVLEIESRILKALQPDLHLNPEPLQDRYCSKPLTKKLNLKILWSWKRRKLSDITATNIALNNSYHVTQTSGSCATENSSSQSGIMYQERGEHNILSSNPKPQENNIVLGTTSQYNPLTSDYHVADSCNQSVWTVPMRSNFVSLPKQHIINCNSESRKSISPIFGERGTCETQAMQGHILLMKPKQEPVDLSEQKLPGSQAESIYAPKLQLKNNLLYQQIEGQNVLGEKFQAESCPSLLIDNDQPVLEGMPNLLAGMPNSFVKQEPAETSIHSSYVRNMKDKYFVMDTRTSQSNLQQLEQQGPLPLLRANIPPTPLLRNHIAQGVDKTLRNESVTQKRKALQNPLVPTGVRSAPISSQHRNSLPRLVSVPARWKTNSHPEGTSTKVVNSFASTSNLNAGNASSLPVGNLPFLKPSEPKVEPFLEKLLKIEGVTQRYGLNNKKRKLDKLFLKKPNFHTTPLVAFHLLISEENRKSKDAATDKVPLLKFSIDRTLNVCETRTLTFVRQSRVYQGNEIPMVDREAQIKLVISEKLNEGIVEASVHYGHEEEIGSFVIPLLFSSTHSADLFTSQFTSLMMDEQYHIGSDVVEPMPFNTDGVSSSPQSSFISNETPVTGTVELPSLTFVPGLSPFTLNPMGGRLSAHNILSRGHLLPPGNIQSALQLSGSCLSKPQLHIAAALRSVEPQWRQILNKRPNL